MWGWNSLSAERKVLWTIGLNRFIDGAWGKRLLLGSFRNNPFYCGGAALSGTLRKCRRQKWRAVPSIAPSRHRCYQHEEDSDTSCIHVTVDILHARWRQVLVYIFVHQWEGRLISFYRSSIVLQHCHIERQNSNYKYRNRTKNGFMEEHFGRQFEE
jgi:hypothetical protein